MRKRDKEEFYRLVDGMKALLDDNKVLSKKDVCMIINELINLKLRLEEKSKAMHWYWGN